MIRLEQHLHDLLQRITTEQQRHASYFSLPDEYRPNRSFNALPPLPTVLGTPTGAAAGGKALKSGAAGTPATGKKGLGSEAGEMEQD